MIPRTALFALGYHPTANVIPASRHYHKAESSANRKKAGERGDRPISSRRSGNLPPRRWRVWGMPNSRGFHPCGLNHTQPLPGRRGVRNTFGIGSVECLRDMASRPPIAVLISQQQSYRCNYRIHVHMPSTTSNLGVMTHGGGPLATQSPGKGHIFRLDRHTPCVERGTVRVFE